MAGLSVWPLTGIVAARVIAMDVDVDKERQREREKTPLEFDNNTHLAEDVLHQQ